MKRTSLFLALFLVLSVAVKGQFFISCTVNFEDNPCWEGSFSILNSPGTDNVWHICTPAKTLFDSAFSMPHAILTDSAGPYPVSNVSSFIIKVAPQPWCECGPVLGGYYKFDSDSLKDYGRIEVSLDHGTTWLDALSDTVIPDGFWMTPKPVLTGRIHEWKQFFAYGPFTYSFHNDTLFFRFTFISDSIQTNQQGWMLDDIAVIDHLEGIRDHIPWNDFDIYPNPASGIITVSGDHLSGCIDILVYDISGRLRLQQTAGDSRADIDISGLEKGRYIVKVFNGNVQGAKMIIKN